MRHFLFIFLLAFAAPLWTADGAAAPSGDATSTIAVLPGSTSGSELVLQHDLLAATIDQMLPGLHGIGTASLVIPVPKDLPPATKQDLLNQFFAAFAADPALAGFRPELLDIDTEGLSRAEGLRSAELETFGATLIPASAARRATEEINKKNKAIVARLGDWSDEFKKEVPQKLRRFRSSTFVFGTLFAFTRASVNSYIWVDMMGHTPLALLQVLMTHASFQLHHHFHAQIKEFKRNHRLPAGPWSIVDVLYNKRTGLKYFAIGNAQQASLNFSYGTVAWLNAPLTFDAPLSEPFLQMQLYSVPALAAGNTLGETGTAQLREAGFIRPGVEKAIDISLSVLDQFGVIGLLSNDSKAQILGGAAIAFKVTTQMAIKYLGSRAAMRQGEVLAAIAGTDDVTAEAKAAFETKPFNNESVISRLASWIRRSAATNGRGFGQRVMSMIKTFEWNQMPTKEPCVLLGRWRGI